ncbi:MAG: class I SAM-dependent methyltransferase [Planctomycetes bacterium]|nr:class I SAM-dependent methyltransferase [Planctomycetota bacterium]
MRTPTIQNTINTLEAFDKQGESYANAHGRFGWRNPIREDTGELLYGLVLAARPRRVLEVGTAHGLSGLYLASALPAGSDLVTLELDPEVAAASQARFDACEVPVQVIPGDALEQIPRLAGPFDLVFLDAQKDQYLACILALLEHGLLAPGAMILADNVLDRAAECAPLLEWCRSQAVEHTVIGTACGLLVARLGAART